MTGKPVPISGSFPRFPYSDHATATLHANPGHPNSYNIPGNPAGSMEIMRKYTFSTFILPPSPRRQDRHVRFRSVGYPGRHFLPFTHPAAIPPTVNRCHFPATQFFPKQSRPETLLLFIWSVKKRQLYYLQPLIIHDTRNDRDTMTANRTFPFFRYNRDLSFQNISPIFCATGTRGLPNENCMP